MIINFEFRLNCWPDSKVLTPGKPFVMIWCRELFIRFTARAFRKLLSVYVHAFSYFPLGFEGRIWDLIVSVPDHCLSFYFSSILDKIFSEICIFVFLAPFKFMFLLNGSLSEFNYIFIILTI